MATTFDTLRFTHTLQEVGVPEKQAETDAQAIQEAFAEVLDTQVATKADIVGVKTHIAKLETKMTLTQWLVGLVIVVEVLPYLKTIF